MTDGLAAFCGGLIGGTIGGRALLVVLPVVGRPMSAQIDGTGCAPAENRGSTDVH